MTTEHERANPALVTLRRLAWTYFALLLVEGALRKWIVPGLSQPLYLVRDPVVVAMYAVALRHRVFPDDVFTRTIGLLAVLFGAAGFVTALGGPRGGLPANTLPVILNGLRANFLHLPLIFLLPKIFGRADVIRAGTYALLVTIPMAVVMVLQFQASPHHWLNAAVGGGEGQMMVGMGRVRPAGFFAFNAEMRYFLPMVLAYLLYGVLKPGSIHLGWLLIAALALMPALAVSGNRGALGGVLVVLGALCVVLVVLVHLAPRILPAIAIAGLLLVILTATPLVDHGVTTLEARIRSGGVRTTVPAVEAGEEPSLVDHFYTGVVARFANWFVEPFEVIVEEDVPWLGAGLGMGSPAGARLLGAPGEYLLAHDEWPRILMESGPILGFLFILFRCVLGVWIGLRAFRACVEGDPLALLLFGAFGAWILMGSLGRAATAGFMVWGAGLTLAAAQSEIRD